MEQNRNIILASSSPRRKELLEKIGLKFTADAADFAEDLNAGRKARLQIIVDGTDSNTASIAASYAEKIATAYSEQILMERVDRALRVVP